MSVAPSWSNQVTDNMNLQSSTFVFETDLTFLIFTVNLVWKFYHLVEDFPFTILFKRFCYVLCAGKYAGFCLTTIQEEIPIFELSKIRQISTGKCLKFCRTVSTSSEPSILQWDKKKINPEKSCARCELGIFGKDHLVN